MKEKVYAEIGIGNKSFLSTEFEAGNKEYRVKGFIIPKKINGFYLRIWILKRVLVISPHSGFKLKSKDKNKLKLLFGIEGYNSGDNK